MCCVKTGRRCHAMPGVSVSRAVFLLCLVPVASATDFCRTSPLGGDWLLL